MQNKTACGTDADQAVLSIKEIFMPPINLLIKPASSNCNLRCSYCFYHSISETRMTGSYGVMSMETLEVLVKKALSYADDYCNFAFQGGEPTLAGIEYYKTLIALVSKHNEKRVKVNYSIQTNGIIIDEEWAKFLADNKFLVGISLDGPKDIHDHNRIGLNNKGTFNGVMKTIEIFNKYHVEYNILCVVNSLTARYTNKVYNFFKKNNFNYLQFIPCLDALDEKPGNHNYSLTPEKYTFFLKTLFDEWYKDVIKGREISIRYFDNLVGILMGYKPELCGMAGMCPINFIIEADGGVYPCDFFVIDEWHLGNINNYGFEALKSTDTANRFVEVSGYIDPNCKHCEFFSLCRGGCRRNREPFDNGKPILNYYCKSYKEFFKYAGERLVKLANTF